MIIRKKLNKFGYFYLISFLFFCLSFCICLENIKCVILFAYFMGTIDKRCNSTVVELFTSQENNPSFLSLLCVPLFFILYFSLLVHFVQWSDQELGRRKKMEWVCGIIERTEKFCCDVSPLLLVLFLDRWRILKGVVFRTGCISRAPSWWVEVECTFLRG